MNQRLREGVWVGLAIAVGIAVIVAALITVGAANGTLGRSIDVTVDFDDVQGLREGDKVRYAGVNVGTIDDLELAGKDGVRVTLAVDRSAAEVIPSDVAGRLGSDGLIGNRLVDLVGGSSTAPLSDGDAIAATESVSSDTLMADLQSTNEEVRLLIGDLRTVTQGVARGEGTAGRLLVEDDLYEDVSATVNELRVVTSQTKELTKHLTSLAAAANSPDHLPYQVVHDTDTWPTVSADLKRASGEGVAIVTDLRSTLARKNTPLGVMLNDEAAGQDLGETLDSLNTSSDMLQENLLAMRSNMFFRRYFRKQAAEEDKRDEGDERDTVADVPDVAGSSTAPAARTAQPDAAR